MTWWRRPEPWAGASAAAVLVANVGGLAIGDDGVGYRATADSLLAGRGLGYFLEPRLTIWPPGWPALMALVARITPFDTEQAAIVLNAATAALIVLLVHRLLRRLVESPSLRVLGTAVAAIGPSSMVFGHLLMTDFAFAAVTLAIVLALANWRDARRPVWLAVTVALVWAGFMIRYAGIVHIGTVGLWLLLDTDRPPVRRLTTAAGVGLAAAVVPGAWIARNLATDDTALGIRYSSARGLPGNVFDLVATIGNFLAPGVEIERRTIWIVVALGGCTVVGALAWRLVRSDERFRTAPGLLRLASTTTGLLVVHIGVYATYMLYARTTTGLNRLDFRLLNPLYLPLVLLALVVADRVARDGAASEPWPRLARASVWAWAGLNVAIGIGMIGWFATSPDLFVGNYERAAFEDVRTSPALDALPDRCDVSSNLPNALYGSGVDAEWSPRNTGLESNDPVDDLAVLARTVDDEPHCLVWIDLEPRYGHLATLEQLRGRFTLDRLAADGVVTVYEIEPR